MPGKRGKQQNELCFFLGGRDLEMIEIARLLSHRGYRRVWDKQLSWGARLSDYRAEIEAVTLDGSTAVAIELTDDLSAQWPPRSRLMVIDHHGHRAGRQELTALEQIFRLIAAPPSAWTRRMTLVAANDRGHVDELRRLGASKADILRIRTADRRAQGVAEADEREAQRAIKQRRENGQLTVVVTSSATSSAIADFMLPEFGGPGYDALLVVMPTKLAVFGSGHLISRLAKRYRQSWFGGALPDRGYWGMDLAVASEAVTLERFIRRCLAENS